MIQNGQSVTDVVSGFKGVVVGVVMYITGCNQALVIPKVKDDGAWKDGQWFDLQRLKVDTNTPILALDNSESPGHDAHPPAHS